MIIYQPKEKLFHLMTDNASYVFGVGENGHLIHFHYGHKLDQKLNPSDFDEAPFLEVGSSTTYHKNTKPLNLNLSLLEIATYGKGDYREPTIHIETDEGYRSLDFKYDRHEIVHHLEFENMPQATKEDTLQIILKEVTYNIELKLNYTVVTKDDTLIRNIELINEEDKPLRLDKMLSANFDFKTNRFKLVTLDGAWIKERHVHERDITYGIIKIDSKKGVSSSDHNPYFMLKGRDASKEHGEVYGFNLIYSGNFEANIELSPHDLLRVNMGINSFDFKWALDKGEHFITPEVVSTYSNRGILQLQEKVHRFTQSKIIKETRDKPIMINNWEATYFDFNERKILAIAKKAKKLGIEGIVLDDGWFGQRDDDTSSLGDWTEHTKKLPKGLSRLSRKVKKKGLSFGLWVEPEMISPRSELYRMHPDWAICHPRITPALGRNQLVLDLSNPEVVDYLIETLTAVFKSADVDMVKWDMNRNFSDSYSAYLSAKDQGKLAHLYTLGLYRLLATLKSRFSHVWFESCASGGNRFDLGMHYYMSQAWTSDNTDAFERLKIQSGTYLGYPLSTVSNHVNDDIAHQTIRHIPIETRFNVAAFGVLGYELDPRILSPFNRKVIQKQISFYKQYRRLFQYGTFYDVSIDDHDKRYMVVSEDKKEAILGVFQGLATPNPPVQSFQLPGLDETLTYRVKGREQYENLHRFGGLTKHALPVKLKPHGTLFNILANRYLMAVESFDKVLSGKQMSHHGLPLEHRFTGTGYHEKTRLLLDFSSRLYILTEVAHGND